MLKPKSGVAEQAVLQLLLHMQEHRLPQEQMVPLGLVLLQLVVVLLAMALEAVAVAGMEEGFPLLLLTLPQHIELITVVGLAMFILQIQRQITLLDVR
jgi:hypothetical protein